jgi:hypothetical protein
MARCVAAGVSWSSSKKHDSSGVRLVPMQRTLPAPGSPILVEVFVRRRLLVLLTIALAASPLMAPAAHAAPRADASVQPQGFFVIGDVGVKVGATVQFWGAQWAKNNSLSGGPAPRAFKGFAETADDPICPTNWSTDPGNSTPPPASVASDITVIVSSSIDKSGPVISGNVVELATVHTEPGYEGNPGHAGFGTVTALVSCGGPGGT